MRMLLLIWLWLVSAVLAQTPSPSPTASPSPPPSTPTPSPAAPTTIIESVTIEVQDKFDRPWIVPPDTAWVGVRLLPATDVNPKLRGKKTFSADGLEYAVGGDDYQRYPLEGGVATVQFVIWQDASQNPVSYELALIEQRDGSEVSTVLASEYQAGVSGNNAIQKIDKKRPSLRWEQVAVWLFGILGAVLTYLLFGRELFRRMLFNRRMEVASAEAVSNACVLAGLVILLMVSVLLVLYPVVLWGEVYWVYVVTVAAWLALLFASYLIGFAMTRA